MEPDAQADDWKPPYLSYQTLTSFIDIKLGANPLPPRIDRGFLDSYAGSVQALLLQALKTIGLITDSGAVTQELRQAASHPNGRKAILKKWASEFYAEQSGLATANATAQMLHESFAKHKISGSTLRKAIVFYLTLADDVGLPKSPHFKPPRQAGPPTSRPKKAAGQSAAEKRTPENPLTTHSGTSVGGETVTVDFGTAGKVVLQVNVKWLELPKETFTNLRDLIDQLGALATERGSAPTDAETEDGAL